MVSKVIVHDMKFNLENSLGVTFIKIILVKHLKCTIKESMKKIQTSLVDN